MTLTHFFSAGVDSASTLIGSSAKLCAARANCRTADVLGKASRDQHCYESAELGDLYHSTKRARTDTSGRLLEAFESACGEALELGAACHSSSSAAVSAAQPGRGWSTGLHTSFDGSGCGLARPLEQERVCHPFSDAMTNISADLAPWQLPGTSPEGRNGTGAISRVSTGEAAARSSWRFAGSAHAPPPTCRGEKPLAPAGHGLPEPANHAHLSLPAAQQTQWPAMPSMPVASVAVSHGSSSGCAVRLTAAELAELARGSEAALRRGLEACHQSFLQHQRQQHSASAAAQAQSRQPVLLGPSSAASSVPCCGVSRGDSFPLARVSTHSSSGGQWSSTCGRCVVTGSSGSFEVASCGSAGCERIYAAGGRGSSYSSPMPVAPPTPPQLYDLANAPRECILLTCRGLCLSADTTGRLALHIWTRVASLARLLLSVRPATAATAAASTAYGGTGAAGAAAGLQVFAVAAVWVAAKLEERRQEVPGSGALAVAARSSPAALAAAELRILQWCDWSPYAGFVPDESYLLTWGP